MTTAWIHRIWHTSTWIWIPTSIPRRSLQPKTKEIKGLQSQLFRRTTCPASRQAAGGPGLLRSTWPDLSLSSGTIPRHSSIRAQRSTRIRHLPATPVRTRGCRNGFANLGIGAAVSIGGQVGLGPAAEVIVVDNNTRAFIGKSARVNAAEDVEVIAESTQDIMSIAGAGALGIGAGGLAGAVPVISIDNETSAYIEGTADGQQATMVNADGNIAISAVDRTETDIIAGSLAGGPRGDRRSGRCDDHREGYHGLCREQLPWSTPGVIRSGSVSTYSGMDGQGNLTKKDVKGLSVQAQFQRGLLHDHGCWRRRICRCGWRGSGRTIDSSTSAYIGKRREGEPGQ